MEKTKTTNREYLLRYIDMMDEQQIEVLLGIASGNIFMQSTDEKLKFAGFTDEQVNKIDSAYPIELGNILREIMPNTELPHLAYSYNEPRPFGALLNVDKAFLTHLHKTFIR